MAVFPPPTMATFSPRLISSFLTTLSQEIDAADHAVGILRPASDAGGHPGADPDQNRIKVFSYRFKGNINAGPLCWEP
jgi:hypothetical protein